MRSATLWPASQALPVASILAVGLRCFFLRSLSFDLIEGVTPILTGGGCWWIHRKRVSASLGWRNIGKEVVWIAGSHLFPLLAIKSLDKHLWTCVWRFSCIQFFVMFIALLLDLLHRINHVSDLRGRAKERENLFVRSDRKVQILRERKKRLKEQIWLKRKWLKTFGFRGENICSVSLCGPAKSLDLIDRMEKEREHKEKKQRELQENLCKEQRDFHVHCAQHVRLEKGISLKEKCQILSNKLKKCNERLDHLSVQLEEAPGLSRRAVERVKEALSKIDQGGDPDYAFEDFLQDWSQLVICDLSTKVYYQEVSRLFAHFCLKEGKTKPETWEEEWSQWGPLEKFFPKGIIIRLFQSSRDAVDHLVGSSWQRTLLAFPYVTGLIFEEGEIIVLKGRREEARLSRAVATWLIEKKIFPRSLSEWRVCRQSVSFYIEKDALTLYCSHMERWEVPLFQAILFSKFLDREMCLKVIKKDSIFSFALLDDCYRWIIQPTLSSQEFVQHSSVVVARIHMFGQGLEHAGTAGWEGLERWKMEWEGQGGWGKMCKILAHLIRWALAFSSEGREDHELISKAIQTIIHLPIDKSTKADGIDEAFPRVNALFLRFLYLFFYYCPVEEMNYFAFALARKGLSKHITSVHEECLALKLTDPPLGFKQWLFYRDRNQEKRSRGRKG